MSAYRLFPLTVSQGGDVLLVGVAAVPWNPKAPHVSHRFIEDIANQLFQAGDVTAVKLVG
jgi:hypothetical protein